jgi:hypothetical protein
LVLVVRFAVVVFEWLEPGDKPEAAQKILLERG